MMRMRLVPLVALLVLGSAAPALAADDLDVDVGFRAGQVGKTIRFKSVEVTAPVGVRIEMRCTPRKLCRSKTIQRTQRATTNIRVLGARHVRRGALSLRITMAGRIGQLRKLIIANGRVKRSKRLLGTAPSLDADDDGFRDSVDVCPNLKGVPPNGCPTAQTPTSSPTPPAPPPTNQDSDGDTVPDSSDRCPSQAASTSDGCPVATPQAENRAPTAQNIYVDAILDGYAHYETFNASDPDGDPLTYEITGGPWFSDNAGYNGLVFDAPNGSWGYQYYGYSGYVWFDYQAIDSHGARSNTAVGELRYWNAGGGCGGVQQC